MQHLPALPHAAPRPRAAFACPAQRSVESIIQRVRAHRLGGARGERAAIGLEVRGLEGHRLLVLDAAGPLVEVALAPGTYHVSTELAGVRRSYTVSTGARHKLRPAPASGAGLAVASHKSCCRSDVG